MSENELTKCPLCSHVLKEIPKGSATLFVCTSCGFRILATRELFPKCFKKKMLEALSLGDIHEQKI